MSDTTVSAGKAAWKLDDPVVLAAERAERLAAAADAARRKLANALDKKVCVCVCTWAHACSLGSVLLESQTSIISPPAVTAQWVCVGVGIGCVYREDVCVGGGEGVGVTMERIWRSGQCTGQEGMCKQREFIQPVHQPSRMVDALAQLRPNYGLPKM
jgi:hypothetical protein